MQTPRPINDPTSGLVSLIAIALSALLLIGQALFIVPAGKVAVVTTLGKVSGGSRLPGLNLKIPFVQSIYPFDVRTQVRPEEFATLTKDLQVIEALLSGSPPPSRVLFSCCAGRAATEQAAGGRGWRLL